MPCVHEFGVIRQLDPREDYDKYSPEKYDLIQVEDDLLSTVSMEKLWTMKSYFHALNRPEKGLAWYGITLIPPESCGIFYEAVRDAPLFSKEEELQDLASLLRRAGREHRYVIHYGI